jgi:acetolactate synthase-1/3 small subunit
LSARVLRFAAGLDVAVARVTHTPYWHVGLGVHSRTGEETIFALYLKTQKLDPQMQTLIAYVENKPGVLNRVSSLARRLAINIDSLTVGPTENEEVARMTIVAHTDEKGAHRLEASLEKLVDVLLAENISERCVLERDLALLKVAADQQSRPHLMELIKVFRGRVVDVAPESLIVEVSGTVDKIDGLLEVLRPFGVLEMARTGRIAMTRGGDLLQPPGVTSGTKLSAA